MQRDVEVSGMNYAVGEAFTSQTPLERGAAFIPSTILTLSQIKEAITMAAASHYLQLENATIIGKCQNQLTDQNDSGRNTDASN